MNPDAVGSGTEKASKEPLAEATLNEAYRIILLLRASKRMYELQSSFKDSRKLRYVIERFVMHHAEMISFGDAQRPIPIRLQAYMTPEAPTSMSFSQDTGSAILNFRISRAFTENSTTQGGVSIDLFV